jgi:ATP-dependent Clp protease ATP-binding subunit ClpA
VIFNQLGFEAIEGIVENLLEGVRNKLKERNITITLTSKAKHFVASEGFDPLFGARPLKRALYEIVEDSLADLILEGKLTEGDSVVFDEVNGEITTQVTH